MMQTEWSKLMRTNGVEYVRLKLSDGLVEVTDGIGSEWQQYPVLGATRQGVAPAKEAVGKSPERYKLVAPGMIFYNPMRIRLGSIAMVDDGEVPGITSPDYVVIKTVDGKLHHRWFYHWFRSPWGDEFIRRLARGAVRQRILFRRLAKATIDVPSWELQRDYAEQLLVAQTLARALSEQLAAAEALPQTLIRASAGKSARIAVG